MSEGERGTSKAHLGKMGVEKRMGEKSRERRREGNQQGAFRQDGREWRRGWEKKVGREGKHQEDKFGRGSGGKE